ncbi:MAG: hypothetical protein IV097_10900 [Burkholderiaceae bacterium]|uniref:Uncharacterized protein n=1 Tax=Roseateles toxinivorans TaxID=270368 RepID=A0A4R6QQF4_9BURK|nr:hypothetical protein [Roseateles toxinivorans]MBT9457116.1 hypothetical protein [Burkholderiaceae bacterium]TDP72742.1 hypothetical protein DES47_102487 [Roseateles toxinivorans]
MKASKVVRVLITAGLVAGLAGLQTPVLAQLSEASVLSGLPIAVSVAAPVMLLSAGAMLTVVAVEASAAGTVCVLERASDGARASIKLSGQLAGGVSMVAGTAVLVTAMSTGYLLSAAGAAVAFIPNEIGKALLYNERVTR